MGKVDDHPPGYPQFAAFIDSDPNFLMCRKFGWLRGRVLLDRQDELNVLERRLLAMDDEDKEECPLALKSRKVDNGREDIDEEFSRKTLLQEIDAKLEKYGKRVPLASTLSTSLSLPMDIPPTVCSTTLNADTDDLVARTTTFANMKNPPSRNYSSFRNWVWDRKPLTREESRFIQHVDDLVALADGQEDGWFDGMVEDVLGWLPRGFVRVGILPFAYPFLILSPFLNPTQPPDFLLLSHPYPLF